MATDQPGKFETWSRAIATKPMYLFPDQGLNTEALLDRIGQCLDYLQRVAVRAFYQFWRNALRSVALTCVLLAIRHKGCYR